MAHEKPGALAVLNDNLVKLQRSRTRLQQAYRLCVSMGKKDSWTDEEFLFLEALTSRYARTTDMLVNKTLRSIDVVEFVDTGTLIDTMNRAIKRGIISAVSEIRSLKDLRNEIAHEYETDDIAAFFTAVMEAVPKLDAIIDRTLEYCAPLSSL